MELFFNTLQITLGIIAPFVVITIIISLLYLAIGVIEYRKAIKEYNTEKKKKEAPFDQEAKFYKVPNPTMIGVILYKDGKKVWGGAIDKDYLWQKVTN